MADQQPPAPSSAPEGKDPNKGTWRWNYTTNAWEWFEAQENPVGADTREGNQEYNDYWRWAQTQLGRPYIDLSSQPRPGYYEEMRKKYGDLLSNPEEGKGLGYASGVHQTNMNAGVGGVGVNPPHWMTPAGQQEALDYQNSLNPKDNGGAFSTPPPAYNPFSLSKSGTGMGGGMGAFGGASYGSNTLTPQLEQIRMQRVTQNYGRRGGF